MYLTQALHQHLRTSALVMKLVGWGIIVAGPVGVLAYAPGFFWGELPPGFPLLGPAHPPSPYAGAHPYLLMIFSLYLAWAILLIRGARDPKAAASLFDWGILANALHGSLMVIQAFTYPNEHAQFFDALPPELTAAELDPHYQRIERALQVAPGPQDERRLAIKAGAVVRDLCAVRTIERVSGGYEVRADDGRQGRTIVLRAPRVVVAAGTLNTLKMLLRSTVAGGVGTIPGLGRHFSMAADTLAFYRVPRDIVPETITGHIVDAEIRVPGSGNEFDHLILCATAPMIPGSWLLRRLQGRRTLPLFGFGPDAMDGQVSWEGRGIVVRHQPQAVVGRIQVSLDRIAQALGREKPIRQADPQRRVRPWLTFHPIGGCRMAADASRGVVDFRGEVFGHPGLYVADASVLPTMTIAGPQLSVSALASWIAERIIKDAE